MKLVADAAPLIFLAKINQLRLLNELVSEHNFRISTRVYAAAHKTLLHEDNFT